MNHKDIIEILRNQLPTLQNKFGVDKIGLIGSYARNEQQPDSDIDVLVKFNQPDLKSLIGLLDYLENMFNKKIDIVMDGNHLSERFRKMINSEIIYA